MSLSFVTNAPQTLLSSFKKNIDEGHVRTWSYDNDGDFTHSTSQWRYKAWLRPVINSSELRFNILRPRDRHITSEVYAIYHGHFIYAMLEHCDSLFTEGKVSAKPTEGDNV